METLRDLDVVRAVPTAVRADTDDVGGESQPLLEARFSPFGVWYEIDSMFEGTFLERTVPGAFRKTIKESRDQVKVLFNHGFDPSVGDKVLGQVEDLREDDDSPVGRVRLFGDAPFMRDLLPGLKAGVYGSSFRFRVTRDEWHDDPGQSDHNPRGLPERTVKEVQLFEFGPVTFPANPAATASARSMTDAYYERLRSRDPRRVDDMLARALDLRTLPAAPAGSSTGVAGGAADTPPSAPAPGHPAGLTPAQRRERLHPTLTKE